MAGVLLTFDLGRYPDMALLAQRQKVQLQVSATVETISDQSVVLRVEEAYVTSKEKLSTQERMQRTLERIEHKLPGQSTVV